LNKKYRYLTITILISVFIFSACPSLAAPILRVSEDQVINNINLDNRFGTAPSFSATKTFNIYNDGNTSMTISSVTASSPGSGITMSISSSPSSVAAGSSGIVTVSVTALSSVPTGSYSGVITVITSAGSNTMKLSLNIINLISAKLGSVSSISSTIRFDKPKGSVNSFTDSDSITLNNIGDSTLYIDSITFTNPTNGIIFSSSNYPQSISPRSSNTASILVTAPSSASEGTINGQITITTSKEAQTGGKCCTETQNVIISVTVEYGVNMEVSKSLISFGDTELLNPKEESIQITETLGYKSINNIKITKLSGAGSWLTVSPNSLSNIYPFGSDRISVQLLYEGDAKLYQKDEWAYTITSNAGSKNLKITSTNVPPDVKPTLEKLSNIKYKNDNSRDISENCYKSLKYADDNARANTNTYKKDELISLIAIANSVVNLLDSYAMAEAFINKGDYDNAYESLIKGVVSAKIINTYSEKISDTNIKNYINIVNEKSSNLMNSLLEKETNYYESKKDSNLLESMIANERLSELWGILGNEEKRVNSGELAKEKFVKHNNYVDSAKNTMLEAENQLREVQDTYLSKWGGSHILSNPFYYSKVSQEFNSIESKYNGAIQSYDISGEKEMVQKTNEDLERIKSDSNRIFSVFYVLTGFYSIIFIGILSRTTKGIMAYVRDTTETRMGDNFL
jgi:hypothetical protein